jgi:aryl-alcohol dehydrogenase-like predicted oxidoreductase
MKMRKLGNSGLEIAPLGLGGNVFGWTVTESTACEILDAFVGEGFNFIDTANVYSGWAPGNSGGESELIIGRWLRKRPEMRPRVLIATKVGVSMGLASGGLSRATILKEVDESLTRLNTEYIDIYQSHVDDPHIALDETLEAYALLVRLGKVRSIGASNYTPKRLAEALETSAARGYPRYESLECQYNLYSRASFEGELAALCQDERLGVIPYSSLANGFLTAKYRSAADFLQTTRGQFARQAGDVDAMFGARGSRILESLATLAKELRWTPAQLSLAWLLAHGAAAPIASVTSTRQLTELTSGVTRDLPQWAVAILDAASAP